MKRGTKRDSNGRLDGHMRESEYRAKNKRNWLDEVNNSFDLENNESDSIEGD
jgi:hypothetical protein